MKEKQMERIQTERIQVERIQTERIQTERRQIKQQEIRKAWLFTILLFAYVGAGCSSSKREYEYYISYVDSEQTQTVQVGYEPQQQTPAAMIQEFLERLATDTDTVDYVKAIPEGVGIRAWNVENGCLDLDFNSAYDKMDPISEILCRLAIVRTMTQIDGIESVRITVKGDPLEDSKGNVVGKMTIDSFVENPGEQINSFKHAAIDLFFSNENGDGLVKETQEVYYNSNISMEKLVIEHLILGPKGREAKKTIPEETKLINVAVVDGSCYVNLDDNFRNHNYEIQESIVIYSIVNSLASLENIDRVQISVNGDTNGKYRDDYDLSRMYQPDYRYVEVTQSRSVIVKDVKGDIKTGD